ncbi:piggyBac transposable element-derived protein 4-like [Metopolophium dirhodum]|uniref:piggyBac transposable element-derived protein 4-like n=1 Tax=Metopolophium dirhodum TaxID=44670 RepID=UPI0029906137|nr:piggyBac transposable element-derived protein 4-like [Metopolophium dirhodum]
MADSSTILRILRELSEDESGEESGMEVEDVVDDSDEDPDYVPNKHNFQTEEEISEVIREIETRPIPPLKSRKRKINSTSKTDSNNGENERETDQNKHIITISNTSEIVGKNGFVWKTECNYSSGKVPQKNIVHIRPGPSYLAKSAYTPKECFKLFFTDELINLVLIYTNQEIQRQRENYKNKNSANLSDLTLSELNALFGLLILAAALKNNHLTTNLLFDSSFCGNRYRATMSEKRFCFLINCLRFDDRTTRLHRKNETKLAPISVVWDILMINCKNNYKPSSYVTIDEQLVGFRGRCPFRMYIPSKPTRYGIKIVMMCDNATKYVIDSIPYMGKGTVPNGQVAADFYVKNLVKSIKGSNRNLTMDNWFCNVPHIQSLLHDDKPTVIGTIKKNKRELPTQFTDIKFQNRTSDTSFFLFHEDFTVVSYKPNQSKLVTLISSAHHDSSIDPITKKPEIVLNYNATKGGVDSFDQMTNNMNCSRKTKRWPLCFFL